MHKLWLVAKHEFLTNIKRRSFLFAAFGIPIFTIVIMMIVFALVIDNEEDVTRIGTVGYVDQAGVLVQRLDEPEYFTPYETEVDARAALDAGTVGAYFVLPPDYMDNGMVSLTSSSGTPAALNADISAYLRANLGASLDTEIVTRIQDPVETRVKTLDNGRVIGNNAVIGLVLAPIIFVMVFMMASQTTSGYLMSGVVEEKGNRIMEILVTSLTPFQLLLGKIIGLGALGLTQLVIWLVGGYVALSVGQNTDLLAGVVIPTDMVIVGVIYFLLDYFLLASLMAGIGAVVGSEQESRQFAGIFSLVMVIPFFAITSFFTDPNGALVVFLTLFPLTAPVAVILRMGFGVVPTGELLLSIALLFLMAVFVAWASARIFRWSLLMYGKRPGIRELFRVIRRAPGMATTASGDRGS